MLLSQAGEAEYSGILEEIVSQKRVRVPTLACTPVRYSLGDVGPEDDFLKCLVSALEGNHKPSCLHLLIRASPLNVCSPIASSFTQP